MSTTGLDVFDRTIHKTNTWLKELMDVLECEERQDAYLALRATLHALRDRLTIEEVAQLAAQLPMLIRGFYYEGWDPTGKPMKANVDDFLTRIEQELGPAPIAADEAARGVFLLLSNRISEGEIEDIEHVLPKQIRDLWPTKVD